MFLTADNLSGLTNITHGFFTRNGGVSEGIYETLNAGGRGTGDTAPHVDENRRRIAEALGTTQAKLLSMYQIHSPNVITVEKPWDMDIRPEGDAMVTTIPGIALGILTADCVPILFADAKAGVIGAAHAGWKGALYGVVERTIAAMAALGADPSSITAAIGPAITQPSYEVSDAFRQNFIAESPEYSRFFLPSTRALHWQCDLKGFVKMLLSQSGISSINMLENDTCMEEDRFYSYRRATHRNEPDYGRQISAILLKPLT